MNIKLKNIVLLLTLSSFLFIGCKGEKADNLDRTQLNKVVPVSATTAGKTSITNEKTFAGSLEGIRQSNVVAKIAERIVSIHAQVGQHVNAGQVIIELDKTGASSQYIQAKANLENTQREMERMRALFKEGAVARQAVDQIETAYSVAKANFDASRSTVDISAPVSGTVTAINVNPGDWVTPGSTLAVVAEIGRMIITFNVSEAEVSSIKPGSSVRVYSEFNKDISQTGRITEINRSASLDARSFKVKAEFPNTRDNFYKPGMFVKADLVLKKKDNVLTVPTQAVINETSGSIVYKIKNGVANPVNVKTGFTNESLTEITEGIAEGDSIVTQGMNNLSDNTKVSIVKR